MKSDFKTIQYIALVITVFFFSCSGKSTVQGGSNTNETQNTVTEINSEAQKLLTALDEMGDYVNSNDFPSLIKASLVNEALNEKNLVVDLRSENSYAEGHIKGAVNVDFSNLPKYFTNDIKPFEYEKIVLVCYSGQISSYAASLLRLAGYGNIYAMRWGMSGWNRYFAVNSWLAQLSSEYEGKLETVENVKASAVDFPLLNTGKSTGEEILQARIDSLFAAGYSDALISAGTVFENPEKYYTINYDRKDKYDSGHIPGAVRYKPDGTLGIVTEMQTIPTDREVIVYCSTGHNSGFVTAYLRLFGYDAKTLTFGNNAFMHDKMQKEESSLSWLPFTVAEIENFPYEVSSLKK